MTSTLSQAPTPMTLDELLGFHDEAFVTNAYLIVLGRDPDPDGLAHYLARVRSGAEKAEIIADLAKSAEGRRYCAELAGLRNITKKYNGRARSLMAWLSRHWLGARSLSIDRQLRVLDNNLYLVQRALAEQTKLITELLAAQRLSDLELKSLQPRTESSSGGQPDCAPQPSDSKAAIGRTFRELKDIIARNLAGC